MDKLTLIALALVLLVTASGCDFVGDVLEFSAWLLLIGIVVIVLLIWAVYAAFFD